MEVYRDIILDNNMDFTDIIKFFNGLYFLLESITTTHHVKFWMKGIDINIILKISFSYYSVHNWYSFIAQLYKQHFFVPEMAERHKSKQVLKIAQDLIHKLQTLIENKWFRFIDHSRCSKGGKAERMCDIDLSLWNVWILSLKIQDH